ncbi:hypothetical protein [Phormidium sp. CCY1219]|uniref:hypothetical protein n=1 Tax=Phormidium sp. CCY1219 TaxID=2886104 RepID=UPI002D1ED5C9|nr:hypothetical protein [Phormidium sp. CCY1219]MEB3830115.1 hypothetical protein [Phormidium sp. CCY1219]
MTEICCTIVGVGTIGINVVMDPCNGDRVPVRSRSRAMAIALSCLDALGQG